MKNIAILGNASQLTLGYGNDYLEPWKPNNYDDHGW
jgi:hypothetical protein